MFEKSEQVAADLAVTLSQPSAMVVGGREHHNRVQLVVQPRLIAAPRALGQLLAPPRQHDGPQQQCFHAWGEDRVARLDSLPRRRPGAYLQSRSWCARQTCHRSACPCCAPYRSETRMLGRWPAIVSVTT